MDENNAIRIMWSDSTSALTWAKRYAAHEADRRKAKRAATKPAVTDARRAKSAADAAAATARAADPQGTKAATHRAEREAKRAGRRLYRARRAVPSTLPVLAAKSAAGLGLGAAVVGPQVPDAVWTWAPVAPGAALAAWVGSALWRGRADAEAAPAGALEPTAEEAALLERLQPEHWTEHADGRGLGGTLTGRPELTEAGVTASVRLDGQWTVAKLAAAEEGVRALLGARTGLRLEVVHGDRGGWAVLTLRTRSAVDGADMAWTPERPGIGLDTVTGQPVPIPLNTRLLLAGSSGAGKSVTLRPALAELAADPLAAVVMVDLKRVEGALWKGRARIARTPEEVIELAAELAAEMMDRLEALEATGRASWTPTAERPRIVVVIDEGAEVSAVAKDALADLESVARMGRAAEIHLWWCTQKPTMSGTSAGIPAQVAAQMDVRLCLRVATATEVRTVLGEDATAGGWDAHTLPKPGVLMIRGTGRGPVPVKVWHMTDDQVRALPPAPVWHRGGPPERPAAVPAPDARPALRLVKDAPAPAVPSQPSAPAPAAEGADARVLAAVRDGAARQRDVAEVTGLAKGTVSKAVKRLTEAGALTRSEDGVLAVAEVSA